MKKSFSERGKVLYYIKKTMQYSAFLLALICAMTSVTLAGKSYGQQLLEKRISVKLRNATLNEALDQISEHSGVKFVFVGKSPDRSTTNLRTHAEPLGSVLPRLLDPYGLSYQVMENSIVIREARHQDKPLPENHSRTIELKTPVPPSPLSRLTVSPITEGALQQATRINGTVKDEKGESLPGVNILIKGTQQGTVTDINGKFSIEVPEPNARLVFSFVGYLSQELETGGRSIIDVTLSQDEKALEELVVVGYGTQKKSDLTGAVVRANIDAFREQPNVSILQSLQGSVPGLNVGQINRAGQDPEFSIRGRTSISGTSIPLVVLDGIIFRGNLVDLNPNDIASIDILKDASAAAIYGSQASNGVIIVTTKSGGTREKPVINYSTSYTIQSPIKTFKPGSAEDYIRKVELSDWEYSRTPESGYTARNPNYSFTSRFKIPESTWAYNEGIVTDWYDLLTRDNLSLKNHDLSVANKMNSGKYYISAGYTDQVGYMQNENFSRWNARINIDNKITRWLDVGIQSYLTSSDYSGIIPAITDRYELGPYTPVYNANGELVQYPGGNTINPYYQMGVDDLNKRLNLSGNIFANIEVPFVKGLSYRINFGNNYTIDSRYVFRSYGANFQGSGEKAQAIGYNQTMDHIVKYRKQIREHHDIDLTLLYGYETRNYNTTRGYSEIFINNQLGYNNLQSGSAERQSITSGAWEEASIYRMARFFYGYRNKYLLTATIRRDGFSGFSENNKFGVFPSFSIGWALSEEPFLKSTAWIDLLKLRASYGSNGNRTLSRYQTLATVSGGYNYITGNRNPTYTQSINSLASPNLKWETTTGVNIGIDYGFLRNRFQGSLEYYNNNTTDLLYNVDIPGVSRFETFPDNLGKLHNKGLELSLTSVNLQQKHFTWTSTVVFSRNRNELRSLLGFDNDGDGKEDNLVSEGLFSGEPLSAIFAYRTSGNLWQLNDEIPLGFVPGSYKVDDVNEDGVIDPKDRTILGYRDPSFRFSINNEVKYKNWTLRLFINSVQGGKDYYMGPDDMSTWKATSESHFPIHFPKELMDFWSPENPNARYHRLNMRGTSSLMADRYLQRSFVRLQDVSLAYDFPSSLLKKVFIDRLKVFVSGKNLATWTKWNGWDPETGENITLSGRPVMRSFTVGINLGF